MTREVKLGSRWVGDGHPVYIIAEVGINHNGDLDIAKQLIDSAAEAGCDAVKFQKRTPELCVPEDQRDKMRHTPWGYISYMEYREKVEFNQDQFSEIVDYCKEKEKAFIIGGAGVYAQALPLADKLELTFIDKEYEGDTFFPEVNYDEWELINKEEHQGYSFNTFVRKK